ncbi:MAG: ATP-binding protein [Deltaproteobacteria bacterium]|nr:ATP-binding protein [Deltaproteobacteria bacterium]
MLVEFRVDNHRSIRDEHGLTMEASNVSGDVSRVRDVADLKLLPVAALYGANASGKTNVLAAIQFMRDAVAWSDRLWPPDQGVPREAFAWGKKRSDPSLFQATFILSGVKHEYGFVVDDERVVEEWLKTWPNGRVQTWYTRDGQSFDFGERLHGENRAVEKLTRPNALFLSAAAQSNHKQLSVIYRWFRGILGHVAPERMVALMADGPARWFAEDAQGDLLQQESIQSFLSMLKTTDIGVVDIKVTSDDGGAPQRGRPRRILLKHRGPSDDAWLPLEQESHGTRRLFRLGPRVIHALQHGGIVIIDELEAGFHPLLALEIVRAFHDPKKNPKNAQLLFTTHDTNLLGTVVGDPVLRRDQVWLTEKDESGGTRFYPLTDYQPRKSENLERGYLQGRYGAIPFLGNLAWTEKP